MSSVEHLRRIFEERGDFPAVLAPEGRLSFAELGTHASIVASQLSGKLKPGDRVGIQLENSLEFAVYYFACLFGGFTCVPLNAKLSKADRDYMVHLADAKTVVSEAELGTIDVQTTFDICSNDDDVLAIFFTSGTTSRPKGVAHSVKGFVDNALAFNALVGIDEECRMLHTMPMSYIAGFLNTLLCPLLAGGSVVLAPQFSAATASSFWEIAMEHDANAAWFSPTMLAVLSRMNRGERLPRWTKEHLRHVLVGTAPLPPKTRSEFEETFGVQCLESYGMTEILLTSSNTPSQDSVAGSVGKLLEGVEAKTLNDDSLMIRSPYCMKGYLDPDTKGVLQVSSDSWFDTGDLGRVSDPGDLSITGRKKDLIIHGGMNVSPRAVEEVLLLHPAVQDAAVIGVPHVFWGEEVCAFVLLKSEMGLQHQQLRSFCQERLPQDAVPSKVEVVREFPRTETGKVQKKKLRVQS